MQTPILFVSDSPDTPSGLSRIARDLAIRVASLPQFRVGFLGKGGLGSSRLPFPVMQIPESINSVWGEEFIHIAAQDFFRGQQGIIFTIWDISRTGYISWPEILQEGTPSKQWLLNRPFKLWGYFPVDCSNIGNRIHPTFMEAYNRYDRKLFYTRWAYDLARSSGLGGDVDWIPHGIPAWVSVRRNSEVLQIGCVGTNQIRKDWGLTFATVAWLKDKLGACKLWAHIDRPYVPGRWNLPSLTMQFGLQNDVKITTEADDATLSDLYGSCDCAIANGLGEGFGLPIAESLACGTPVVHGDYAGGAGLLNSIGLGDSLVKSVAFRIESEYGSIRPVYRPEDFGEAILKALALTPEKCRAAVEHLHWDKLWPSVWAKWFLRWLR